MQNSALIQNRVPDGTDAGFDAVWEQAACMSIQLDNVSEALLRSDEGWLSGALLIERLRQIQQMRHAPDRDLTAADDLNSHKLATLVNKSYTWARGAIQLTTADPLFRFVGVNTNVIYFVTRRPLLLTHQPFAKWHRLIPIQVAAFDLSQGQVRMLATAPQKDVHPHVLASNGFFCTGANSVAVNQALSRIAHNVHGLRAALRKFSHICETITEGYERRDNPDTYFAFTWLPREVRTQVAKINNETTSHWTRPIIELPKETP